MKVLHLPNGFLPWTVGGREVFAYSLAVALQKQGVENHIAFHQGPLLEPIGDHSYRGLPVTVLPPIPGFNSQVSRYTHTYAELPGFEAYVARLKPDVIHFHDQNGGASLSHLRVANQLGIRTIVTYHSPGQSCSQYELLFRGKTVCDGLLLKTRCTSCRLSVAGVPEAVSNVIAALPLPAGSMLDSQTSLGRMLSARAKTNLFINSFYEFIDRVDKVQVLAEWTREVMLRNHVDPNKLALIRTAATVDAMPPSARTFGKDHVLRVVFMGRCTGIKGIHVLIDAVKTLPADVPLKVSFFGPYWTDAFGQEMLARMGDDPRFEQPVLIPNDQLQSRLAEMDVAAIPSTWLETGPLTFFDAQCAGLPVVGSRLGGLAELIDDGRNGLLFEPGNAGQLGAILMRLAANPSELNKLRAGIGSLRLAADLASDMIKQYQSLIES